MITDDDYRNTLHDKWIAMQLIIFFKKGQERVHSFGRRGSEKSRSFNVWRAKRLALFDSLTGSAPLLNWRLTFITWSLWDVWDICISLAPCTDNNKTTNFFWRRPRLVRRVFYETRRLCLLHGQRKEILLLLALGWY